MGGGGLGGASPGPLVGEARGLSATYRRALDVALGVREGASPDQLMLSNAALALLTEAQGNPLALLELPVTLSGLQRAGAGPLPEWLPLSRRLQAAFESRITALPAPTRRLLLPAVLEGTGRLATVRESGPRPYGKNELNPAERAGLVRVSTDAGELAFRHPLIRSAVVELSTSAERREAHAALAGQLGGKPERQAWHLGQAAAGPDERVAGLLEQTAQRIRHRGDAVGAVTALLRAADLTPPGSDRSRRAGRAGQVAGRAQGRPPVRRTPLCCRVPDYGVPLACARRGTRFWASGLPQPVTGSQPGPAW